MLLLNKVIYIWELIPIPVQWTPVDSGGLQRTPFSGLQSTLFYFIPADSSGLRRNHRVTICDMNLVKSAGIQWVQRIPAEHVGECKVLVIFDYMGCVIASPCPHRSSRVRVDVSVVAGYKKGCN